MVDIFPIEKIHLVNRNEPHFSPDKNSKFTNKDNDTTELRIFLKLLCKPRNAYMNIVW